MSDSPKDRIADVLKRKLDEIQRRDGDLSSTWASRQRHPDVEGNVSRGTFGEGFTPSPDSGTGNNRRASSFPGGFLHGDPAESNAVMREWIDRYRGQDVATILDAKPLGRKDLLDVRIKTPTSIPVAETEHLNFAVESAIWLVTGIRDSVAGRLAMEGRVDLSGLVADDRFGGEAERILKWLRRGRVDRLMDQIGRRGGRAHPINTMLSAFFIPDEFLFLDIETMGLFGGSPIVVVGLAYADGDGVEIRQLVAASPDAEAGLVAELVTEIDRHPALVTFNGRSFDFPFVCQRAAYYGVPVATDPVHFDLLGYSRRLYRERTTDCKLDTLARQILDMHRDSDVSGSQVPVFYTEYLKNPAQNAGLLAAIAIHNAYDMEQTVRLWGRVLQDSLPMAATASVDHSEEL